MSVPASSTTTPIRRLLGKAEIAEVLGIGVRTLERLIAAGEFPKPDRRIGRMARWRPETIESWIGAKARR